MEGRKSYSRRSSSSGRGHRDWDAGDDGSEDEDDEADGGASAAAAEASGGGWGESDYYKPHDPYAQYSGHTDGDERTSTQ